jgi:predicted signal transduction protein with EAL and GGDEF domain
VRRLHRLLRPNDTIARLAGDEFVVVCEDIDGPAAAVTIAERISAALDEPFALDSAEVFASASIGIAVADSLDDDAEPLLRSADTAMYQAKRRGGSRHELFDEELRGRAHRRLRLEHDLRSAVRRGELRAVYQPLVSLPENAIVGVETLLRWDHPEFGPIAPDDFIAIAEDSGTIIPLGAWVLRAACQQLSRWRAELTMPSPFTVYVNLSSRQLTDPGLVEVVSRVLKETGVRACELGLEITEASLLEDTEAVLDRLAELKRLGVRLAMDDFGTGYSSLSYLRRMPLDVVKVDRSFVHGLGTQADDLAIVAAVVHMAVALRLNVTAEGVETSQQLSALEELGCESAQGFYFAKPVPADEIETLIVEHAAATEAGTPAGRATEAAS